MTTGLAIPVGVNSHGGAKLTTGDAQALKIIGLTLSDNDNDNAFQQNLGLGIELIFDPASPTFRAKVRQRLISLFDEFEKNKKFKLIQRTIRWSKAEEGEQTLEFSFVNMESDETIDFEQSFVAKGR